MAETFAMWGAPVSGKTTYLLSLLFWQEHGDDKKHGRRLCVLPATPSATDWVVPRARAIAEGGNVAKTDAVDKIDFRLYDLPPAERAWYQRPRPSRHVADLVIWDAPGDFYVRAITGALLQQFVGANGLILMLNPFDMQTGSNGRTFYWNFLNRALGSIQAAMLEARTAGRDVAVDPVSRQIQYPVAICLTHADLSDRPEGEAKQWLDELLGPDADLLYKWMARFKVFSLSALGPRPAGGAERRGDPRPIGVMYPMEWLLDQCEEMKRVRTSPFSLPG